MENNVRTLGGDKIASQEFTRENFERLLAERDKYYNLNCYHQDKYIDLQGKYIKAMEDLTGETIGRKETYLRVAM